MRDGPTMAASVAAQLQFYLYPKNNHHPILLLLYIFLMK